MKITQKTILITGASSGLGRALALQLATGRNNLIVTARRQPLLASLKQKVEALGGRCLAMAADAIDTAQARSVIAAGIEQFGRIDIAVLNAGGGKAMSMADTPAEEVLRLMRVNYDTLVNSLCPLIDSRARYHHLNPSTVHVRERQALTSRGRHSCVLGPGVARRIRRHPADLGCGSAGRAGEYERELERAANARSIRSGGDLACRGYCQRSRLIGYMCWNVARLAPSAPPP